MLNYGPVYLFTHSLVLSVRLDLREGGLDGVGHLGVVEFLADVESSLVKCFRVLIVEEMFVFDCEVEVSDDL